MAAVNQARAFDMIQASQPPAGVSLYLTRLNMAIIQAAAERRQRHGQSEGARAPAALGQPAVRLHVLTEPTPSGRPALVTPLGYHTARRQAPRILAGLGDLDPRRRAADILATAFERVQSVGPRPGGLQGSDHSGGQSDGGATTRVKHAERLRIIEALVNGWAVDWRHGSAKRGAEKVALSLGRPSRKRKEIRIMPALIAVCVEGQDLAQILAAHGWSVQTRYSAPLGAAVLDALAEVGEAMGFGRAPRSQGA